MTFQVWGWRREASQVWAWVPDAVGGRGAAMPRRTPGEHSVRVLGRPEPLGSLAGWQAGRQARGSTGKMQEPAFGRVWGPQPGRGAAGVQTLLYSGAAGAHQDLPSSSYKGVLCLVVAPYITDCDGHC